MDAGYGLAFTVGRGNDVEVAAVRALAPLVVGLPVEEVLADLARLLPAADRRQPAAVAGPEQGRHPHGRRRGRQRRLGSVRTPRRQAGLAAAVRALPRAAGGPGRLPLPAGRADPRRGAGDPAPRRARTRRAHGPPAGPRCARLHHDAGLARLLRREAGPAGRRRRSPRASRRSSSKSAPTSPTTCGGCAWPARRSARTSGSPWTPTRPGASQEAIGWMRQLAPYDPYWIEEPTSPDEILGHAAIRRAIAPVKVATGEHVHNQVMFKQMLQAGSLDVLQLDASRTAGVTENVAILLLAAKYNVPVCPHAGGVGLCEMVQHLAMFDYVAVSGGTDGRVIEYVDHLHEHFTDPVRIRDGHYLAPTAPGLSAEMHPESVARPPLPRRTGVERVWPPDRAPCPHPIGHPYEEGSTMRFRLLRRGHRRGSRRQRADGLLQQQGRQQRQRRSSAWTTRVRTPTSGTPTSSTPRSSPRSSASTLKTTQLPERRRQARRERADLHSQGVKGVVDGPAGHRRHRAHARPARRARRSRSSPSTPGPTPATVYMVVRADNRAYGRRRASSSAPSCRRQGRGRHAGGRPVLDQRPRPHRGVQRLHEAELPRHQGLRRGHQLGRRHRRAEAADRPDRAPGHQGRLHGVQLRPVRHAAAAQAEGPAGLRRATPSTSSSSPTTASPRNSRTSRRARSTPPSPSPPTCTPSTPCTTSRPRSTGKTFKPGPTDHDSTIIQVRAGVLEDQLSAPLVTADGGTYGGVASVKSTDTSLWGNHLG